MDQFIPAEIAIKHAATLHHTFTLEFGPSVLAAGRAVRNTILVVVAVHGAFGVLKAVLNRRRETTSR